MPLKLWRHININMPNTDILSNKRLLITIDIDIVIGIDGLYGEAAKGLCSNSLVIKDILQSKSCN